MDKEVSTKLDTFSKNYSLQSFKKGEVIVWANEDPPGVIFLKKGNVGQYDIAGSGQKLILNIFKPPAFFPMSWAINKTANKYFFESLTDLECRIAPADEVLNFLSKNNDVTLDLLSRLYRGTDGLLERVGGLMAGNARSQLVLELLISAYRFGEIKQDGSARLIIKVTELAERTGLARETVSRELKKLEDDKVITRQRNVILVSDIKLLSNN